ncbi:MAG: hypothetical protein JWL92_1, partial [Candidatus Nomurabacteria bacterium]|nr:hypothetical protein [Candidatus Nomurabacteria bacterium]
MRTVGKPVPGILTASALESCEAA